MATVGYAATKEPPKDESHAVWVEIGVAVPSSKQLFRQCAAMNAMRGIARAMCLGQGHDLGDDFFERQWSLHVMCVRCGTRVRVTDEDSWLA